MAIVKLRAAKLPEKSWCAAANEVAMQKHRLWVDRIDGRAVPVDHGFDSPGILQ